MTHATVLPLPSTTGVSASVSPIELRVERARSIRDIDQGEWNALIPRDEPHLRYAFLEALETSGQCRESHYFRVFSGSELVGAAVAYHLRVDLLTLAPRRYTAWIDAVRSRIAPNLLFMGSLTCGPIVTNCRSNVYVSPLLDPTTRHNACLQIIAAVQATPKAPGLTLFFEFDDRQAEVFAPAFLDSGFLQGVSLPGTFLDVRWNSLEQYVQLMRKAFRRTVVKDQAMAADLEFMVVDDFTEIADEAYALYRNVVRRADYVLQELTLEFFRAIAPITESRLVVARERGSGRIVGIELLLRGETVLQDVFTGLDYARNAEQHLYFNLIYPVIGYAGEQGFRRLSLGQTSYTFKSRLGVGVFPLWLFVKHRNPVVQRVLVTLKSMLFPPTKTASHKVFRDETPS